jgi:hypothetical protein
LIGCEIIAIDGTFCANLPIRPSLYAALTVASFISICLSIRSGYEVRRLRRARLHRIAVVDQRGPAAWYLVLAKTRIPAKVNLRVSHLCSKVKENTWKLLQKKNGLLNISLNFTISARYCGWKRFRSTQASLLAFQATKPYLLWTVHFINFASQYLKTYLIQLCNYLLLKLSKFILRFLVFSILLNQDYYLNLNYQLSQN